MSLSRRHKWILVGLFVYWLAVFVATHLPIHDLGARTGMSDKAMHLLAYLGLVFFAWAAVSPNRKVNWVNTKVWILLVVIVWYGVADEILQGFVGRSAEVLDFAANMVGVLAGLGILTAMGFWPAALVVSAIFTFVLSNMARLDHVAGMPHLNIAFHFTAYAGFALVWIQYLQPRLMWEKPPISWFLTALSVPTVLLTAVKLTAPLFGRPVWFVDCATALAAIVLAAAVARFVCRTIWLPAE